MSVVASGDAVRDRCLRALGVARLRLRSASRADGEPAVRRAEPAAAVTAATDAVEAASPPASIKRLALQADPAERSDPAIDRMYVALTEAVTKAGLQPVRVCDAAGDPSAAVMVFGAAPVPDGVPADRVLRADPLATLHRDRERKRRLWERMCALGHGGAG